MIGIIGIGGRQKNIAVKCLDLFVTCVYNVRISTLSRICIVDAVFVSLRAGDPARFVSATKSRGARIHQHDGGIKFRKHHRYMG